MLKVLEWVKCFILPQRKAKITLISCYGQNLCGIALNGLCCISLWGIQCQCAFVLLYLQNMSVFMFY